MKYLNQMTLTLPSLSKNEAFARSVVAAFCAQLNPTVEEINDIKTAVSEAVTNCVVHGYNGTTGEITVWAALTKDHIYVRISDHGIGIPDVKKAIQPFYTTKPQEERSGMGFTVMQAFMDECKVTSKPGSGTEVLLSKRIGSAKDLVDHA